MTDDDSWFSFSWTGLIFLLMLFIPNILWTTRRPSGYTANKEHRILAALEHLGQALVCMFALFTPGAAYVPWTPWSWWLAAAFSLMILYELWWVRYFRSSRTLADFYTSILGIPLAGATLPVAAFLLFGVYAHSPWLIISSALLGIGHIGLHAQHARDAADK